MLAAVFALAAAGKLADRTGSREAAIAFGVPSRLAGAVALVLPLAELAVAVALVPASTAWYGAIGALGLLVLFSAAIAWALARGQRPDCHCFGQLHSAPAGPLTLVRNAALVLVAGFLLTAGRGDVGHSVTGWVDELTTAEAAALAIAIGALLVLAVQGWFLWQVLRQNGNLLLRIESLERSLGASAPPSMHTHAAMGLPLGADAPAFELPDHEGARISLETLRNRDTPVLLTFVDPDCGPCTSLMPEIARWQADLSGSFATVLISSGSQAANSEKVARFGVNPILIQPERSVSDAYGCSGTPCAVLVSADGRIMSAPAGGPGPIRELVELASSGLDLVLPDVQSTQADNGDSHARHPRGLPVGYPAPALTLHDFEDAAVDLNRLHGQPLAVLFWNPGCGYCRRILPEIKQWETEAAGVLQPVFLSRGSAADNLAMGLTSKILVDDGFVAGRAFGASGTPSAVLIDADGNIASTLAAGAPSVLALVRSALQQSLQSDA